MKKVTNICIILAIIIGCGAWYYKSIEVDTIPQEISIFASPTEGIVNQSAIYNGAVTLRNKAFAVLNINGNATLENITCNVLTINGVASVAGSTIQQATIRGVLKARNSSFETIHITTAEMSLDATQCNELTVHPSIPTQQQKVILRNQSIVQGNIIFEQPSGFVILESGSEVKGKIIGGSIQL